MAQVPLNTFRTVALPLTTTANTIYTTPNLTTTIVLMAQVSNISSDTSNVTFLHVSVSNTETELVKGFEIPPNDAASVLTGKLILETGQKIKVSAGHNGRLKLVLSLLETL